MVAKPVTGEAPARAVFQGGHSLFHIREILHHPLTPYPLAPTALFRTAPFLPPLVKNHHCPGSLTPKVLRQALILIA